MKQPLLKRILSCLFFSVSGECFSRCCPCIMCQILSGQTWYFLINLLWWMQNSRKTEKWYHSNSLFGSYLSSSSIGQVNMNVVYKFVYNQIKRRAMSGVWIQKRNATIGKFISFYRRKPHRNKKLRSKTGSDIDHFYISPVVFWVFFFTILSLFSEWLLISKY